MFSTDLLSYGEGRLRHEGRRRPLYSALPMLRDPDFRLADDDQDRV